MMNLEFERVLGRGTFATVWLASDPQSGIWYAVKVLAENWCHDADVTARFLSEGQILRGIAGPGIVGVHDVGVSQQGQPYIVMDYADGGTLADALAEAGRTPVDVALAVAEHVGSALSQAHINSVAHRDLKPANILFRTRPQAGSEASKYEVLIGDFGLARALADASRLTTIAAGTNAYMAPEQYHGRADLRSDVFALGVLAYELLCGAVPFQQPDFATSLHAKEAERYVPVRALCPEAPAGVAAIVERSLAADPNRRLATAMNWVNAITTGSVPPQPASRTVGGMAATRRVSAASEPVGPVRTGLMDRLMAMDQLRNWVAMLRRGELSPDEYSMMKSRALVQIGLGRESQVDRRPGGLMGQQVAVQQANNFRSLVDEGVLTEDEYATMRHVLLYEQGLA